jgi:hypothetical protein
MKLLVLMHFLSRHTPSKTPVRPGTVAQACNPSHLEGRDGKVRGCRPAWAKSLQNPILTNDWHSDVHLSLPATPGSTNRTIVLQACLGIKQDPITGLTKARKK